jgi:hypothetical protein
MHIERVSQRLDGLIEDVKALAQANKASNDLYIAASGNKLPVEYTTVTEMIVGLLGTVKDISDDVNDLLEKEHAEATADAKADALRG